MKASCGWLLVLAAVLIVVPAQAKKAKKDRAPTLEDCLVEETDADGKTRHAIDMPAIERLMGSIAPFARNYPPRFPSDKARKQAEHDIEGLVMMLEMILENNPGEVGVLLLAGQCYAMGHNLDLSGYGSKAAERYESLLAIQPDHPEGNLEYGMFLIQTATGMEDSLPYLEKAVTLGHPEAHHALGMYHLAHENMEKADEHLTLYLEAFPDDATVKELLEALRAGKIKVRKHGGEPAE